MSFGPARTGDDQHVAEAGLDKPQSARCQWYEARDIGDDEGGHGGRRLDVGADGTERQQAVSAA